MKKQILILMLAGSMAMNAQSTWKADKAHSNINFVVTHLVISEVNGKFNDFEMEATADDTFSDPSFSATIQTASVDTDNERRDGHLKSGDFFSVEEFPTMSFTSKSLEKTGENTFKLTGDLTMHGVTKSVTLDGKLNGIITDQRSQKLKAGLKFTGVISRAEFGVGGTMVPVGDEVTITINTEMNQQ